LTSWILFNFFFNERATRCLELPDTKESVLQITIAGFGNIGHFVYQVFSPIADVTIYDPPKGMGRESDLVDTDFVFICVPTAPLSDGGCDTSIVEKVVSLAFPRKAIICHSTISVGTTERLLNSQNKPIVFVPEYAGESPDHIYRKLDNRNFFVLGGYEPATSYVKELFTNAYTHQPDFFITQPVVAEIVKYMENSFLALKIGFCNEFFDLCEAVGADYETVRDIWLQDHRINESHTTVTQERGYGGSCLPKDVAAICNTARLLGNPLEILEALHTANIRHRSPGTSTSSQMTA
tara:strand:- start:3566 stop:4447 length:882 start_codon:yes stop_codon:yes gene_type:complete